jgi:hypothetical protein
METYERSGVSRSTPHWLAMLAVGAALTAVVACSGRGGDRTGEPAAATTTRPTGTEYKVPATHPSDWGAPEVELPEAPRPYGPSPAATADPAFYDVTTLDARR